MIQNIGEQIFAILDVNKQTNGTITSRDICGMVLGGSCAHKSKRLVNKKKSFKLKMNKK